MAVYENNVLLTGKDEAGNKNLLYPITRLDCVDGAEDLVHYGAAQSLTDAEKAQARENIGALSVEEAPKAFYVEYWDGELNKSLAEIGEAYNAGSVVFGAFGFSDGSQFTAIMTYFFAEEGFIAALFNGWSADSVKRQVIIQVTDDGGDFSVDINDDATFAVVGDIPATLPNPNALTINGTSYNGSAPVNMSITTESLGAAKKATVVGETLIL